MTKYTKEEEQVLLRIADSAIKFGLKKNKAPKLVLDDYPEKLRKNGASFVTLEIEGKLRGCVGTLESFQPLVQDIAKNGYAAAFKDTRFDPLTVNEYVKLTKVISILSPFTEIFFLSEEDLLRKIRPGIDGLVFIEKGCQETFLPSVWKELPEPKLFLQHLKLKAGLQKNYWSKTLRVKKYTVEVMK